MHNTEGHTVCYHCSGARTIVAMCMCMHASQPQSAHAQRNGTTCSMRINLIFTVTTKRLTGARLRRADRAGGRRHGAERDQDVRRGQAAARADQRMGRPARREVHLPRRAGVRVRGGAARVGALPEPRAPLCLYVSGGAMPYLSALCLLALMFILKAFIMSEPCLERLKLSTFHAFGGCALWCLASQPLVRSLPVGRRNQALL